jgi:hypothetical protein
MTIERDREIGRGREGERGKVGGRERKGREGGEEKETESARGKKGGGKKETHTERGEGERERGREPAPAGDHGDDVVVGEGVDGAGLGHVALGGEADV